jgi:hypothetical protein
MWPDCWRRFPGDAIAAWFIVGRNFLGQVRVEQPARRIVPPSLRWSGLSVIIKHSIGRSIFAGLAAAGGGKHMASTFDPYSQWLGIVSDGFHPDRYRLLGLPAFESDQAKIAAAADAQLKHVRQFTSGPDAAAARKLVEELETARMCLLDGMKKTIYDNLLKQQLATRVARQAAAEAEAKAAVPATAKASASDGRRPGDLAIPAGSAAASPGAPPVAADGGDADIDSLLPPVADGDALLPPVAAPAGPAQAIPIAAGYPAATPVAAPVGAIPVQAMPIQAVPVAGYGAQNYPQAASAYPTGYPVQPAVPQAVPVGGYGAPVMAQAVPVDPYGMAVEPVATPAPALDFAPTNTTTRTVIRRRNNSFGMFAMVTVVPIVLVGVFGLGYYLLNREGIIDKQSAQQSNEPETAVASASRQPRLPPPRYQELAVSPTQPAGAPPINQPDRARRDRAQPDSPGREAMSNGESEKMLAETPAETPTDDPAMSSAPGDDPMMASGATVDVARALMAARYQMANRNLAIARIRLNEAQAAAKGEVEVEEVARVTALLAYVEQFQQAVKESLTALKNKEEFAYGDDRIGVVEVTSDLLVVRIGGANKEYPVDNLPSKLAVAVAEDWFDNNPANKLAIGAFLVVHPKGDRDRARALWQEAQNAGLSNEAALVMPELDVSIPTELADDDAEEPAAMAASDDGRAPVPAPDVLRPARDNVKQVYADDYAAARSTPQWRDLADKLLTEALAMDGNSVERYALLAEARELAEKAGDASVIVRTADALAEVYALDPWELKVTSLETAAKEANTPETNAAIAQSALELTDLAVVFEMYDVAGDLTKVALTAARKSKDGDLLKTAAARNKELAQLRSGG